MLRPNPPRLITIVIAVALLVVGLSATILPIDFVNQALDMVQATFGTNFEITTQVGWLCLLGANVTLIAGSLLPGI
ncbi:MAG TPA: hypothetical protein VMP86_04295 [Candidatus Binatia bacterium]|nr:hypothetical protein [Candidatus Binatia bacterium]